MANNDSDFMMFASAGLILFNATASYELIAPLVAPHGLGTIKTRYALSGTWKTALKDAFEDAFKIDYEAVFLYAARVLDALQASPTTESALQAIVQTAEYVISHAGLLNLDLSGRIYHSTLGRSLAKSFATYYTSVSAGELLAWLSVEKWNEKVCDFACGSGTLLMSAYHKKIGLSFLQGWKGTIGELHKQFVEHEIWGFDAMPFAAHLTLVNLLLQQPKMIFEDSQIYRVPVGTGKRLGSLDLIQSDKITVQKRISGKDIAATRQVVSMAFEQKEIQVPRSYFDVVIMNPPFTKKQRVTKVLDRKTLKSVLAKLHSGLTAAGGLPIPFVALGDLHVKDGGRLALVLPSAALGRDTWQGIRDILLERYDIEHLMINWVAGKPAFSESTALREVLIVARKKVSPLLSGNPVEKDDGKTLISHFDLDMNFTEARQVAEQLTLLRRNGSKVRIPVQQTLHVGGKVIGESVAFPKPLIRRSVANWYRLLAFRQFSLVKQALLQSGLMSNIKPDFDFDFSHLLTPLDNVAQVGLFVKSKKRAGLAVVDTEPTSGATPILDTSKFAKIHMPKTEAKWLIRDLTITPIETFTPGRGILLIPRKANLFATMCVSAVVCDSPTSGAMWMPVAPRTNKTADGHALKSSDVAKLLALWSQSSFGFLTLMFDRQEVEGAWSEWLTEAVRTRHILNPRKLKRKQVTNLLAEYSKLEDANWDTVIGQFSDSAASAELRKELDSTIVENLLRRKPAKLDDFRKELGHEIQLLGEVMGSKKKETVMVQQKLQ